MKKLTKAAVIPVLLGMLFGAVNASAEEITEVYDLEYDPEYDCYYSVIYDLESGDTLIDHTPIYFYDQGSEWEVYDGRYTGYDLYFKQLKDPDDDNDCAGPNSRAWRWSGSRKSGYTIVWQETGYVFAYAKIKIPDSINCTDVVGISGSCGFEIFDLNSENKNLKCVDNVVFSKDGKRLISYAQYDRRRKYTIPDGTEIIERRAVRDCVNLRTVTMPDSVTEIRESAFNSARYELSLIIFSNFDVKIDKTAFGYIDDQSGLMLKSGVTVSPEFNGNTISWGEVNGATYYEIYQKQSGGEYTLLGKTKSTSHTFGSFKPGAEYTFAVKPIAVIPAANYDKEKDEGKYPESFTIEGTVSGDITVTG